MKDLYVSPSQVAQKLTNTLKAKEKLEFNTTVKFNTDRIELLLKRYDGDLASILERVELYRTISFNNDAVTTSSCLQMENYTTYKTHTGVDVTCIHFTDIDFCIGIMRFNDDFCVKLYESEVKQKPLLSLYPKTFVKTINTIEYSLVLTDSDDMFGDKPLSYFKQYRKSKWSSVSSKIKYFLSKK